MEALILAGGLGTRLRAVVSDRPKALAPIQGKPFLSYLIDYLFSHDIQCIYVSLGYQSEQIQTFCQQHYPKKSIVTFGEPKPLGTGGAIQFCLNQMAGGAPIWVLNGDTYCAVDFQAARAFHEKHAADITMVTVQQPDCTRFGKVLSVEGRVQGFLAQGAQGPGEMNAGIYYVPKDLFHRFQMPDVFSWERDFLKEKCAELKCMAYKSTGYFIDIGVEDDYQRANQTLPMDMCS